MLNVKFKTSRNEWDFPISIYRRPFLSVRIQPLKIESIRIKSVVIKISYLSLLEFSDLPFNSPGLHSVFSSYLLIKHISSPIMGWLLNFNHKWKDFPMGNFFTELILRIGFTCPPAMAAKPTLLNKSCSYQKILANLLFQLQKFE